MLAEPTCHRRNDVLSATTERCPGGSHLVPKADDSGRVVRAGGPTKAGDACLREALFISADHARKIDPTLAARYKRLIVDAGKHHHSALCT